MTKQIFCTECNAAMDEGTKFCAECGTKVEERIEEKVEEVETTVYDAIFCSNCGTQTTTEFEFCPQCGKATHQEGEGDSIAIDTPKEKKVKLPFKLPVKPLYIGIAAVVIFLIAMVSLISGKGGSKAGNNIIFAKDKELHYTYLAKLKTFEMTDKLVNNSYGIYADDFIELSEYIYSSDDGRYIFYPDRVDGTVTYYWRDLKADNTKSDAAVKIDSDIYDKVALSTDGRKFFYIKDGDKRLYVFDRKSGEKTKLDDDVTSFYVNEKGDYIYYEKYTDGEYSVYEMTIKGITGEKEKIDSNARITGPIVKEKQLYYTKDGTLYLKEYKKDKTKIASDVYTPFSIVDNKTVYYVKSESVTSKLSALINDDMAASDKDIERPGEQVSGPAPDSPYVYDFKHDVWYANSWYSEYNSDTEEYGYWQEETDYEAYYAAYEIYEKEYAKWEIEYNAARDRYNEEYALYQGKENRDNLRTALDDEDNAITYNMYSIYYWENGTETLVASDLTDPYDYRYTIATSKKNPIVVYQKYSTSTGGSQKLSEIVEEWGNYFYVDEIVWDMQNRLASSRNVTEEVYVASKDKESVIESENAIRFTISDKGTIYFIDNYDTEKSYGTMMSASIKNGVVEKPVKIDDDVKGFFAGNENGNYYYYKDVKNYSGDLYLNGKVIASDVHIASLYNYKGTDTLVYYTDYSNNNDNGTLCISKGGKETKIADDVSYFSPINEKNIAYLTDYNENREKGDLMLYDGKKKPTLVESDVTALLYNPSMIWRTREY